VKITVESTFNLNKTELEAQSTTLGALPDELENTNKLMKAEYFNSVLREVYPDCEVLVNGQSYRVLTDGLDTELKDGDKVEIYLIMLAGG
jgi:molybdopterin converting factor small subunit